MHSYVFVDNSNIFIEGQKHAARVKDDIVMGKHYRLDFGRLFRHLNPVKDDVYFKTGGESFPKLYGSEPPRLDSLWALLDAMGVGVNVFQRNSRNKEKRVDAALIRDVSRLIYKLSPKPDGEIVIVAGDADYYDLFYDAKKLGWKVRMTCWSGATAGIINSIPEFYSLDKYLDDVGYYEPETVQHDFGEWPTDWSKSVPYGADPLTEAQPRVTKRQHKS